MTVLDYLIRLRGAPEAIADADAVAASQHRIASATRRVGTESGIASTAFGRSIGHMKALALGIGGVALGGLAAFAGFEAVKSSVESTAKLAVSAGAMAKVTGMNISTAAQWLSIAQAYGVAGRTVSMSFRTLATQGEGALTTSKKAKEAFHALGITTQELTAHSKDMSGLFGLVADKLNAMPGGMQKTQIAAQLLGRGWQQLMPLILTGSKGMDDLRKSAAAYGITLGGDPLKNVQKLHEAQVKLKLAQIGLQVQLSEKLAPAFLAVANFGLKVYGVLARNLAPAFQLISKVVKEASGWLQKHKDLAHALAVGLSILVAALVAFRLGMLLANAALLATPIGWIILGIAALAAGFVLLWQKSENFRTNLTNVFNWLKGAVSDMIGVFAGMASAVGSAFDSVKWTIINAVNDIIGAYNSVAGALGLPQVALIGVAGKGQFNTPHGPAAFKAPTNLPHPAPGKKNITPPGADMAPAGPPDISPAGTTHRTAHASDIHIHIDGREIAHVTRRQIIRAMAANA